MRHSQYYFRKIPRLGLPRPPITGLCVVIEGWRCAKFITRHSLVRAKGEVFVLLHVFLFVCLFGQRFLSNPPTDSRHILHAGVAWVGTCLLPFWGLAAPGGRKKRQMKFSLLWESMGNYCILAVFERYLSNACTDPHQILLVYGQCLPTCPLPL